MGNRNFWLVAYRIAAAWANRPEGTMKCRCLSSNIRELLNLAEGRKVCGAPPQTAPVNH
jgi:hypothetical protein